MEKNTLHKMNRRKSSRIGYGLQRNSSPKHVIEGKIGGRIKVTEEEEGELNSYWMT
jgi:hypothetical protein